MRTEEQINKKIKELDRVNRGCYSEEEDKKDELMIKVLQWCLGTGGVGEGDMSWFDI